jgi:uncharacterized OB-fold protein
MYKPRYTRDREQNERLVGYECQDCGYVSFPERRRICKACVATPGDWERIDLSDRGAIQSYVVQERLSEAFENPLPLAIVDLEQEGSGRPARVYGLLTETDPEDVAIGKQVESEFRRVFEVDGLPVHSYKFKLVGEHE